MRRVGKWLWKAGVGGFFLLGLLLAGNTLLYLNFDPHYRFLRLKEAAIATGWYLPAYYSHVLIGGVILVIGFLQHSHNVRRKAPKVHRRLGYIYVFGILCLSAPGGFVMSLFIGRGGLVLASFAMQCALWFYFTAKAFTSIKDGNITAHEEWMNRSFALTLAAITLRIYIFVSSFWIPLSQPGAYATLAWLSWVPNLLIAEYLIRKARSSKTAAGRLFVDS